MAAWTCAGCTTAYTVGAPRCPQCGSTERADRPGGAVLPSLTVECQTGGCMHVGKRRRVHLRAAAPGVLEMPSLVCAGCGCHMYRVVPWPPVTDTENTMPKITRHGGSTNAAAQVTVSGEHGPETVALAAGGSEGVSAGSSSETSSEKPPPAPKTSGADHPKRARTTGNRSKPGRTDSSSAGGTDGAPTGRSSDGEQS